MAGEDNDVVEELAHGIYVCLMKKNWSDLKREISGFSKVQLLGLVQDLYRSNERNREFLHARFLAEDNGADLTPYKKRIEAALLPKYWDGPMHLGPIGYGEARRAISDYKKARGALPELLELMLYYVQCGHGIAREYGDMDERFYRSMGSMFGSIVSKLISSEEADLIAAWLPLLEHEAQRMRKVGYGYDYELQHHLATLKE